MRKLRVWLLGVWEFRSDFTTYLGGDLIETYDAGREFAHRVTFRIWDR
jgi:hypothetical protein